MCGSTGGARSSSESSAAAAARATSRSSPHPVSSSSHSYADTRKPPVPAGWVAYFEVLASPRVRLHAADDRLNEQARSEVLAGALLALSSLLQQALERCGLNVVRYYLYVSGAEISGQA
jgi:hypothetical protein